MTLNEAIKELGYLKVGYEKMRWPAEAEAVGLGIEALKSIQRERQGKITHHDLILPDETEEVT